MVHLTSALQSWSWYGGTWEERFVFYVCVTVNASFLLAGALLCSGVSAPYGRYNSPEAKAAGRGPVMRMLSSCDVNARLAWMLQECPTLIAAVAAWVYRDAECAASMGNVILLLCFSAHYSNRAIIYPLRMKGSKPVPLPVMLMAMMFCAINGCIQCFSLMRLLMIPISGVSFFLGMIVWVLGLYVNMDADRILRNLRKPGETGYKIPTGGMFDYVSGANLFGETLEWIGFAMAMGGALPGVTFAFCTACNVGPRAMEHHRWYLEKFKDEYPKSRRAFIPFVL
mmetsp:Transcript_48497/g.109890  ORF Transcript_48497/g.109890 Transcript_48497/m.109890 type:complete len:283 (-) Transcript_48497:86-934(-)